MFVVKGMWDPYIGMQVWKAFFFMNLFVSCSFVRGAKYLGFRKKVRNNNSIFLITQLHTNTYLGLCQKSIIEFF